MPMLNLIATRQGLNITAIIYSYIVSIVRQDSSWLNQKLSERSFLPLTLSDLKMSLILDPPVQLN